MIIAIDTREQRPFSFGPGIETEVATLKTGDYSIVGMTDRVTIERKSVPDLFGVVGRHRARFERELERMAEMDYAAIVIEGTWEGMIRRPPSQFTVVTPKMAVRSLVAWSQRYGIHICAAGPRPLAARLTYLTLLRFWQDAKEGKNSSGTRLDSKAKGTSSL